MGLLLCTKALLRLMKLMGATALLLVLHLPPDASAFAGPQPAPAGSLKSCLQAIAMPKGEEISCDYWALPTDEERAEMQKLTRGQLQDVSCLVKVRIARKLLEPALVQPDHVFEGPPQPVTCQIKTKDGGFPIEGTFAPKVTFKGGLAVDGSPGLGNITGINKYIAWPIVQYVNRSSGIRKEMLEMINDYRTRLQTSR